MGCRVWCKVWFLGIWVVSSLAAMPFSSVAAKGEQEAGQRSLHNALPLTVTQICDPNQRNCGKSRLQLPRMQQCGLHSVACRLRQWQMDLRIRVFEFGRVAGLEMPLLPL